MVIIAALMRGGVGIYIIILYAGLKVKNFRTNHVSGLIENFLGK